jgi:hypothetical protein
MDYVPLCEPWPVADCVVWDGVSPAATGTAVAAASEWLWALSGRQFGACPVLLRPCAQTCDIGPRGWWWDGWSWPTDRWSPGWLGAVCGQCRGACGCGQASTVLLDHPVQAINQVLVDGVELPASGYALYDGFRLVRVGGVWPTCQDWQVPVSGTGAWSIEAVYGAAVPALGELAMAEAAREFGLACTPNAQCRLARNVVSIVRQGVTQNLGDPRVMAELGITGLPAVDRFLEATNPRGTQLGPRIWNPDDYSTPRRPGPRVGW